VRLFLPAVFIELALQELVHRGIEIERKPGGPPDSQPAIEVEAPRTVDEQLDLGAAEWKRFVGLGVKELSGRHAG
jgi:hypothetical protein